MSIKLAVCEPVNLWFISDGPDIKGSCSLLCRSVCKSKVVPC